MATYSATSYEVDEMTCDIIEAGFPALYAAELQVDTQFVNGKENKDGEEEPPLKTSGCIIRYKIRVVPLSERVRNAWDIVITLDEAYFNSVTTKEQQSIIDDALSRVTLQYDKDGISKTDDLNRPVVKVSNASYVFNHGLLTQHARYGRDATSIKELKHFIDTYKHLVVDAVTEDQPDTEPMNCPDREE